VAELRLTDALPKVLGARTATALENGLGLRTVEDLLRHYPRRYAERGQLTDLGSLVVDEHVTVLVRVLKVDNRSYVDRRTGRRAERLEVVVTDGTGELTLTFFKQSWRAKELRAGRVGLFSGKVTVFNRSRQLTHPDYILLADDARPAAAASPLGDLPGGDESVLSFAGELIPVYPATAQMSSWKISSAVGIVLDQLPDELDDPLGEPPVPEVVPVESPFRTFSRVSSAWARVASDSCREVSSWVGSRVASTCPATTVAPAETSTVATVPDTGKATAAWSTGSIVPTPANVCSTSSVEATAVR